MMTVLKYSSSELLSLGITPGLTLAPETVSRCRDLGLFPKKTSRGVRGGVNKRSTTILKDTHVPQASQSDLSNLSCQFGGKKKTSISVGLQNAQSSVNKPFDISELITERDLDVLCITETWLKESGDEVTITEMTPPGYTFYNRPRSSGRSGGGIALVYKSHLNVQVYPQDNTKSFENLRFSLTQGKQTVQFYCIYRPPPSLKNKLRVSMFQDEFTDWLSHLVTEHLNFFVMGDFNIHFDNQQNSSTRHFLQLFHSLDVTQLVSETTQKKGHILDWIVSNVTTAHLVQKVSVIDMQISDHFLVEMLTCLARPRPPRKIIKCRNVKSIDSAAFKKDLMQSDLLCNPPGDVEDLVIAYNQTLTNTLDKHAPLTTKSVSARPASAWYSNEVGAAKSAKRRAERKWRKSGLEIHRQLYKQARNKVSQCVKKAKIQHVKEELQKASGDSRRVFSLVGKLLGEDVSQTVLPDMKSEAQAATTLSDFFTEKIDRIRQEFPSLDDTGPTNLDSFLFTGTPLSHFSPVSEEQVMRVISESKATFSLVDPIPTKLVIEYIDVLLPVITAIINASLSSGVIPGPLKYAVIKPLLKKPSLDPSLAKNYRPVSNLPYLSKLLERVVAEQLISHLQTYCLLDKYQSAYRASHSTETALLRVLNDILCSADAGNAVLLVLLDLSAAFDTIDHQLLLQRLHLEVGITDIAHHWFRSYLQDRTQSVVVGQSKSDTAPLVCGVPQGSVLGPLLFSLYTTQLGRIIDRYRISRHHFADDSQLYIPILPNPAAALATLQTVEACSQDIKTWMLQNRLKLNDDKSEVLLCGSDLSRSKLQLGSVRVADADVAISDSVRNLGVILDRDLSMVNHISITVRNCFFHLRRLSKLRPYIDSETANAIAVALVLSRLDYCNSILWGLPDIQLQRLQHVQNVAAKIVTRRKKSDHVTPILKELHWLPVQLRIRHKLLSLTYSCLYGNAPAYLSELVQPHDPPRRLRSSSQSRLAIPGYYDCTKKKRRGARSFKSAAPYLWNSLPASLRASSPSLGSFKRALKTHFFFNF